MHRMTVDLSKMADADQYGLTLLVGNFFQVAERRTACWRWRVGPGFYMADVSFSSLARIHHPLLGASRSDSWHCSSIVKDEKQGETSHQGGQFLSDEAATGAGDNALDQVLLESRSCTQSSPVRR